MDFLHHSPILYHQCWIKKNSQRKDQLEKKILNEIVGLEIIEYYFGGSGCNILPYKAVIRRKYVYKKGQGGEFIHRKKCFERAWKCLLYKYKKCTCKS